MRCIIISLFVILMCSSVAAQFTESSGQHEFSGKMICRPTSGNLAAASAVIANDTIVPSTGQIYFSLPAGQTENECYAELMAMGIFEYVEPDWRVFVTAVPNDPIYGDQWHHQMIDSEAGWDISTGNSSVVVAVCDTGWEPHQDLIGWKDNYNATSQLFVSQGGDASAVHYHGNATTGVAGATGNNGLGVTGVGWNLSKRMLRVSENSTGSASLSVIQHAVRTAAEQGDQCISVSYSGVQNESNLTTAEYARSLGSLLFWSAGNTNTDMTLRQRDLDDLIVCGGTDQTDSKAAFSAYGRFVDLTGPAVGIWTTTTGNGSTYSSSSGTSFSAPMAAGVAAVVWSADPTLTADEVELILKMGATDKGAPGADDTFGYGRISLAGSLALVGNPTFHRLTLASVTGVVGTTSSVSITLENPEPIHGFSFGVLHDPAMVQVNQVLVGADLPPPEYWSGTNWVSLGGFTIGCVLSLGAPFTVLPPGTWEIATPTYNVLSGPGTDLIFTGSLGNPPIAVEVSVSGAARSPATVPGSITIGITFRRGDVNGDSSVSISDPIYLLLHLFSTGPIQCQDAGDTDDNGSLNLADAMYMLSYVLSSGPAPVDPFTVCGNDITDDVLDCAAFNGC